VVGVCQGLDASAMATNQPAHPKSPTGGHFALSRWRSSYV